LRTGEKGGRKVKEEKGDYRGESQLTPPDKERVGE